MRKLHVHHPKVGPFAKRLSDAKGLTASTDKKAVNLLQGMGALASTGATVIAVMALVGPSVKIKPFADWEITLLKGCGISYVVAICFLAILQAALGGTKWLTRPENTRRETEKLRNILRFFKYPLLTSAILGFVLSVVGVLIVLLNRF